ncbi:MAG: FtsX-like permease family protein, partial [Ilumatobacteraceae bacterium]
MIVTALARLLRCELRGRRLRAMLLFVVVIALASAALVAGLEGQTKATDQWDASFAEANGAHVTIDSDDPAVLDEVVRRPEVAASTHAYRRTRDELDVLRDGTPITAVYLREVAATDLPSIARPLLRDGRWPRSGADDEIVIDRALGLDEGIDVRDVIAIATPDGPRRFTVVGRAVDLIDCFYPSCTPVTAWLDPAGFERIDVSLTSSVFVRLRDPGAVDQFIADLGEYGVGTQGWIDTRDDTLGIYQIFGAFLGAFGVFVMIAAVVVVAGSMATRAVARRRDVGLLKAVGVTPRQVTASIVLAHMAAAAVGVVAGWVLGGFLAPVTEVDLGKVLGTGGVSFSPARLLTALVVVELIVVAATVVPAWRAGRVPTTAALASVTAHGTRGRLVGRAASRLGLGPVAVAGVRDAFGRRARSALTTLAMALALVAVLVTIGTQRTIDRTFGDPTLLGAPEELRVYPLTGEASVITTALDAEPGVTSWFTEVEQDLALGDEPFLGLALGGDVANTGYEVREGRMLARSGEAVAGWGLLNRFGLEVGDEITVTADGEPIRLTIVGWYREAEDIGEVLLIPFADLQRVNPRIEPRWVSVNVAADTAPEGVAAALASRLGDVARVEVRPAFDSDEIDAFRVAFLLVSLLVVIVALANLASTMLLAVRERRHDLGVLRAVGVTPRQAMIMVAAGAAALALAAAAIGIPIGWVVSSIVSG